MTVNVYHKHSVVKSKAPDKSQLELGEIGINANQDSPALYIKDSADNIVEIGACDLTDVEDRLTKIESLISSLPTDDQIESWDDLNQEVVNLRVDVEQLKLDVIQNATDIAALEVRVTNLEKEVDDLKKDLLQLKVDRIVRLEGHSRSDIAEETYYAANPFSRAD